MVPCGQLVSRRRGLRLPARPKGPLAVAVTGPASPGDLWSSVLMARMRH